jgi:hypothetical protein
MKPTLQGPPKPKPPLVQQPPKPARRPPGESKPPAEWPPVKQLIGEIDKAISYLEANGLALKIGE